MKITGRWLEMSERSIPEINLYGKDVSLLSIKVDAGPPFFWWV